MATIDRYKMFIEVVGEDKIKSAKKELNDLNSAVLAFTSVALVGLIASAGRLADELQDLADATGINVGKINALGQSLQQAGGDAKDVGKIITTFYKTLEDMATGGDKAEESLGKVGIGFKDLKTLSSSQLLDKALEGLANMEAGAARTALGIEIFGKAFAKIDPTTLEKILATKDFAALETEMKKVAAAAQSIETSFSNMQQATIKILGQLVGDTDKFTLSVEAAEKVVYALGTALAIAFAASTIRNIATIIPVIVAIATGLKAVFALSAGLTALTGVGVALAAAAVVTTAGIMALDYGLKEVGKSAEKLNLDAAKNEAKDLGIVLGGLTKQLDKSRSGLIDLSDYNNMMTGGLKPVQKGAFKDASSTSAKEEEAKRRVAAATALSTKELIKQNDLQRNYQRTLNTMIGQETTVANIRRANAAINLDYGSQILRLETEINDEKNKGAEANQAQIAALKNRVDLLKQERNLDIELSTSTITQTKFLEGQKLIVSEILRENERRAAMDRESTIYLQDYLSLLGQTSKQQKITSQYIEEGKKYQEEINALVFEATQMPQFQDAKKAQEFYDTVIDYANANWELNEEIGNQQVRRNEKELAYLSLLEKIPENKQNELAIIMDLILLEQDRYRMQLENLKKIEEAENARQQNAVLGAKEAFEQIGASMTPFQVAQDAVTQTFNTMASSLDTFVREGTFKFKDFARSILLDIGLMIAKMYMFQAIQAGLGAFGIGLPGIPGKAMGGPVGKGMPYMVGEKGPELFVPKQAGTIIPNNKLDSASATTAPQAPGPVTNNYATYNISAIDSQSVAQFFAQNRKMALGAVTMAQKELSYGS